MGQCHGVARFKPFAWPLVRAMATHGRRGSGLPSAFTGPAGLAKPVGHATSPATRTPILRHWASNVIPSGPGLAVTWPPGAPTGARARPSGQSGAIPSPIGGSTCAPSDRKLTAHPHPAPGHTCLNLRHGESRNRTDTSATFSFDLLSTSYPLTPLLALVQKRSNPLVVSVEGDGFRGDAVSYERRLGVSQKPREASAACRRNSNRFCFRRASVGDTVCRPTTAKDSCSATGCSSRRAVRSLPFGTSLIRTLRWL